MQDKVDIVVVGDFGQDLEFLELDVAGVVVLHEEDFYLFWDYHWPFLQDQVYCFQG